MKSIFNQRAAAGLSLLLGGFFVLLVILTSTVQAGVLTQQRSPSGSVSEDADLLLFAARTVDTSESQPLAAETTTGDGKALHLIQFVGPIQDSWLTAVRAAGAEPVHYITNYGYLVWADHASRVQLDLLAAERDFLKFSAPYSADLKIHPSLLQNRARTNQDETMIVTIQILRHDGDDQTKRILEGLVVEQFGTWEEVLNYQNLRASIPVSSFETIRLLPDVVWIEPYQAPQRLDEKQTQILAGNLNSIQSEPAGPGYLKWLREKGFSEDPASYPIIDITDDGIGSGIAGTAAGDRTFRVAGDPNLNSRISYLTNCTEAPDASGADGHGHLNASIAAGFDQTQEDPYQDSEGYQRGLGVNPFGRFAGTRVFNGPRFDLSGCDYTSSSLLQRSYQSGARIVSNSWGCTTFGCTTAYTATAQLYDAGVRDADKATPGNQELLILFSAGNVATAGVGSPANGKNVVAVGASENVRPTWFDSCGYGPQDADNVQDIASYSSRGPSAGGRIKPDLVAPGTHITGSASTSPVYNGSAICDRYLPDDQQLFTASTGTSHSVPAAAGVASLATFWLNEELKIEDPSPALLKAFLISSTSYLTGVSANDDLPSNNQGFGLPNMDRAFSDIPRIVMDQNDTPLFEQSGQSWSLRAHPVDAGSEVRIVMAFTDQPGLASSSDPRVNDLDLTVQSGGAPYVGNFMDGQWSQPGGQADRVNTVEAVFLPPNATGSFKITVTASNIAGDGVPGEGDETDQDFVLICDNCQHEPDLGFFYYFPIFPMQ